MKLPRKPLLTGQVQTRLNVCIQASNVLSNFAKGGLKLLNLFGCANGHQNLSFRPNLRMGPTITRGKKGQRQVLAYLPSQAGKSSLSSKKRSPKLGTNILPKFR